jgi:hypothetical protein
MSMLQHIQRTTMSEIHVICGGQLFTLLRKHENIQHDQLNGMISVGVYINHVPRISIIYTGRLPDTMYSLAISFSEPHGKHTPPHH